MGIFGHGLVKTYAAGTSYGRDLLVDCNLLKGEC